MNEMRLDENHDIALDGDRIARFCDSGKQTKASRISQVALCMMRTEEGESFVDRDHGVPWFGSVLELPENHLDVAAKIIKEKLEAIDGVKAVTAVRLRTNGRNLSGSFTIQADDDTTATGEF